MAGSQRGWPRERTNEVNAKHAHVLLKSISVDRKSNL